MLSHLFMLAILFTPAATAPQSEILVVDTDRNNSGKSVSAPNESNDSKTAKDQFHQDYEEFKEILQEWEHIFSVTIGTGNRELKAIAGPTSFNPEMAPPALSLSVSSSGSNQHQTVVSSPFVPKNMHPLMRRFSPIWSPYMGKNGAKSKSKNNSNSSAADSSLPASDAFKLAKILSEELKRQKFNRQSVDVLAGAAESGVRLADGGILSHEDNNILKTAFSNWNCQKHVNKFAKNLGLLNWLNGKEKREKFLAVCEQLELGAKKLFRYIDIVVHFMGLLPGISSQDDRDSSGVRRAPFEVAAVQIRPQFYFGEADKKQRQEDQGGQQPWRPIGDFVEKFSHFYVQISRGKMPQELLAGDGLEVANSQLMDCLGVWNRVFDSMEKLPELLGTRTRSVNQSKSSAAQKSTPTHRRHSSLIDQKHKSQKEQSADVPLPKVYVFAGRKYLKSAADFANTDVFLYPLTETSVRAEFLRQWRRLLFLPAVLLGTARLREEQCRPPVEEIDWMVYESRVNVLAKISVTNNLKLRLMKGQNELEKLEMPSLNPSTLPRNEEKIKDFKKKLRWLSEHIDRLDLRVKSLLKKYTLEVVEPEMRDEATQIERDWMQMQTVGKTLDKSGEGKSSGSNGADKILGKEKEFSFSVPKEATQNLHHTFPYKEKVGEVAAHDSEFAFHVPKEASESKNPPQEASEDFTFPVLHH